MEEKLKLFVVFLVLAGLIFYIGRYFEARYKKNWLKNTLWIDHHKKNKKFKVKKEKPTVVYCHPPIGGL